MAAGVLEGKDRIVELEDNEEWIKVTKFNLLSFLPLLFYFIASYIRRSINREGRKEIPN